MKCTLITTILILSCFASSFIVIAEPTYEITLDPSGPAPLATITFTAEISSDDTISEVYLVVKECRDDICYIDGFNESMSEITSGQYEKEITLTHSDANNIEYWLVINSNGTWYDYQTDFEQKDLKETANGGNGDSNKTPGFEMTVFIVSIALLLIIFKKKRTK